MLLFSPYLIVRDTVVFASAAVKPLMALAVTVILQVPFFTPFKTPFVMVQIFDVVVAHTNVTVLAPIFVEAKSLTVFPNFGAVTLGAVTVAGLRFMLRVTEV